MLWSLMRTGALSGRAIVRGVAAPLAAGTAAWLVCLPVRAALPVAGLSVVFAAVYGFGMRLACPKEMRELIAYIPKPWSRR
jgi:hypothetical protein